jgi:hypothetical protein
MKNITPSMPCESCLKSPKSSWRTEKFTLIYCSHNRALGVFDRESAIWGCYAPLSGAQLDQFLEGFIHGLKVVIDGRLEKEMDRPAAGNS